MCCKGIHYSSAMTEKRNDPAGTTHQFKAFVNRTPADADRGPRVGVIVGVAVAVAVVVLVVVLGVAFVL